MYKKSDQTICDIIVGDLNLSEVDLRFAFFIIWIRALVDAYPKNKFNFLLLLFLSGFYYWFYYFKYYI
jgi:hypothetical protein